MGNLLGAPVTEKETHRGVTKDERLKYGLSSMQGWRVHMEDAHIAEGDLYALEETVTEATTTSCEGKEDVVHKRKRKIPLHGHSLFAVYDGHGGTFAAIYSGNNFLRILSKQRHFVRYAKMCNEDAGTGANSGPPPATPTGSTEPTKPKTTTAAATRAAKKMQLLEQALKQAFVETDYEIGLAIRGKSHADANSPYHDNRNDDDDDDDDANQRKDRGKQQHSNTDQHHGTNSNTGSSSSAMAGAAMKAASDHVSAIEDEGDSGTTSCVVLITPEAIVCANAGDSRAVFARRPPEPVVQKTTEGEGNHDNNPSAVSILGKAIPLSFDHKPDDEEEERRVRNAGGYVANGRVEGDLAVSRGLGDFRFKQMAVVLNNTQLYPGDDEEDGRFSSSQNNPGKHKDTVMGTKTDDDDEGHDRGVCRSSSSGAPPPLIFPPGDQKVSPIPDVTVHARNAERDEYVVVACDGIWDVLSNQQCIAELDAIMYDEGESDLGLVSEEILDTCLRYGSKDNMTAIVVQLPGCEKSYSDAAKAKRMALSATSSGSDGAASTTASEGGRSDCDPPPQEGVAGRRRKRDEHHTAAIAAQQEWREEEEARNNSGGQSPLQGARASLPPPL
ncbi:unnamed protein product [Pseudo-nitzschia multistriata]|uniref:protein-serine/threonine phosphatase n=1 Tax=Pseudo-nitzschia multistriata TaxID=183589 RepID=A0A448Z3Y0_9STRA|nr:unnamed protein product [Pseudo-nitzschia multistriata]